MSKQTIIKYKHETDIPKFRQIQTYELNKRKKSTAMQKTHQQNVTPAEKIAATKQNYDKNQQTIT